VVKKRGFEGNREKSAGIRALHGFQEKKASRKPNLQAFANKVITVAPSGDQAVVLVESRKKG
jgi:hypothetical protein